MSEIPSDIMKAAEKALDNLLCNCRESCGSTDALRQASITDIALAIFAERSRWLDTLQMIASVTHEPVPTILNTISKSVINGPPAVSVVHIEGLDR